VIDKSRVLLKMLRHMATDLELACMITHNAIENSYRISSRGPLGLFNRDADTFGQACDALRELSETHQATYG